MTLITEQLDLAFTEGLHPRDAHGRWVKKPGRQPGGGWLNEGGVLPSSQRFGGGTGQSTVERIRAEGKAALRDRQHAVRRAAGETWTVDEQGRIIRGAHQRDQHRLGAWEFIGPHGSQQGNVFLPGNAEPQVGDMARNSQGNVGRVINKAGGHAVIDADDSRRHLVDWRNGGVVVASTPLTPRMRSEGEKRGRVPPSAPPPSPPGVMVAPGVKQYLLPGMSAPEDYGHTSGPVQNLRTITLADIDRGNKETPHQGIQGSVEIVKLANGPKIVHKRYTPYNTGMADADELSYYVSQVADAGSPPVARPEGAAEGEIIEGYVPGVMAERYINTHGYDAESELELSPEGRRIGILDYLLANPDRHNQNWMVTPAGKPVPIDNSSAFTGYGDTSSPFWDGDPLTPAEYDQLNEGLHAIEPEFGRLGKLDWYRDMMSRLADIAPGQEFSNTAELGWRFDPDEARDAHGRWTHGGKGYVAPDHVRLILPHAPKNTRWPYYRAPEDHPFFRAHPVSAVNIVASYDASSPQEREQGMRWYADAGLLARAIARGDAAKGAGLLASYSPQAPWPANMFNAARSMELGHAIGHEAGMITGSMQDHAQRILDGEPNDKVFGKNSAPKIRAFAHLIEHGGDDPDEQLGNVVIDRHAMSVATGTRLPKKEADVAPIGTDRYYQHVADQYRLAALEISRRGTPVTPHQVQAITWLHQQSDNAAEDEAGTEVHGGKGAGRGRQVMQRNAWTRWNTAAQTQHLPVHQGTTALTGLISSQLDLAGGWHDAWKHEMRAPDGRWVRGAADTADPMADLPRIRMQVKAASQDAVSAGRMDMYSYLSNAVRVIDRAEVGTNWSSQAANWIRQAAERARTYGDKPQYDLLSKLAHDTIMIPTTPVAPDSPQAVATELTDKASAIVPGLLGGGHMDWDHKPVTLYPADEDPHILAVSDWYGHISMQREYAQALADAVKNPDAEISNPDAFGVIDHELIHLDIPEGQRNRSERDMKAYQQREYADIEEGFTELGSIQHAPEFFDRMGIGDRKTSMVAVDASGNVLDVISPAERKKQAADLHLLGLNYSYPPAVSTLIDKAELSLRGTGPVSTRTALTSLARAASFLPHGDAKDAVLRELSKVGKMGSASALQHATMSEYARRLQDPDRIKSGDAWGHYPDQTTWAEQWVEQIAREEGHGSTSPKPGSKMWDRMVELSDEINREGTAKKPEAMARQLFGVLMKEVPNADKSSKKTRDAVMRIARISILRAWASGTDPVADVMRQVRERTASMTASAA